MNHLKRIISSPTFSKITVLLAAMYGQAIASGFQLDDLYNTNEIALSGTGCAAYAADATTNFSNPTGMVNLKKEISVASSRVKGDGVSKGENVILPFGRRSAMVSRKRLQALFRDE